MDALSRELSREGEIARRRDLEEQSLRDTAAGQSEGGGGAEGEDKGCLYLMMPGSLVERVVKACRWDWGAGGKVGEQVFRLMRGGRMTLRNQT